MDPVGVRRSVPVAPSVELSVVEWEPGDAGPGGAGSGGAGSRGAGSGTPVLLVHGLASNARLWDGVAAALAAAGHPVVAVDQRGHGQSSKPSSGYDFETVTSDLVSLISALGWGDRPPIVAGQSWGGNVVLDLAAHHPSSVAAIALVDGGTIDLGSRFADWPTASATLAPPALAGTPLAEIEKWVRVGHPDWPEAGIAGTLANMEVLADGTVRPWLSRENHMQILRSLWEHRPADLYPLVKVPVLIIAASDPANSRWMAGKRSEVARAAGILADSGVAARVEWIDGDHDLHAQYPERVADLIASLAEGAR